ncbi:MAG: AEC family transporter [Planctomycetota bacterium]|nr:AEC family transporter [Planctomycetota bacterium]
MGLVLNAVLPVFLLAMLGFFLFRIGFITREVSAGINQLVYWVGLPCLLFHKISRQQMEWDSVAHVLVAFFSALGTTLLLAYLVAWFFRVERGSIGAFVQAAYRGNLGFIGLPIVLYSVPVETMERSEAIAVVALAPCAIGFNIIAVLLMVVHQPAVGKNRSRFLFSFSTNPLIIGGLLGAAVALAEVRVPLFLDRSLEQLSNMSIPVALLGLGSSFGVFAAGGFSRQLIRTAAAATLLKVVVSPLLGVLVGWLMALDPVEARIVVIYLATPTAIASHVLVAQFRGDEKLGATSIVSATIASVIFLPLALWITRAEVWEILVPGLSR